MDNWYVIHLLYTDLPQEYIMLTHGRFFTTTGRRATLFCLEDLKNDKLIDFLNGKKYELKKVKCRKDRERL